MFECSYSSFREPPSNLQGQICKPRRNPKCFQRPFIGDWQAMINGSRSPLSFFSWCPWAVAPNSGSSCELAADPSQSYSAGSAREITTRQKTAEEAPLHPWKIVRLLINNNVHNENYGLVMNSLVCVPSSPFVRAFSQVPLCVCEE
ncbi:hypothetical protein AVEN_117973-1 [Araneus ventricosus]|uniref:Uncharacterized protein n=1 Tax=Araneus ventricosus TaxID=182803 RepID=A0A4Y2H2G2_ARAVE|nr:hypothetical protein AVEN_117973-1 [Araneus ventricosus]